MWPPPQMCCPELASQPPSPAQKKRSIISGWLTAPCSIDKACEQAKAQPCCCCGALPHVSCCLDPHAAGPSIHCNACLCHAAVLIRDGAKCTKLQCLSAGFSTC